MNIASTVKAVQDIMRKDVGVDGDAQRLGQLVWMLFLKILDDKEVEWEAFNPGYASPLPKEFRWRSWAAPSEGMTGDTLKSFIDSELFPTLQGLGQETPTTPLGNVVRHVFMDSYDYMKSGQLIRSVINRIEQDINLNDSRTKHAFGDMYEQLLKSLQAAGNAGEFYTPRALTDFIVNRLDPKLHDSLIDPACGTGGFLSGAIEHKRERYVRTAEDEAVIGATIHGVEKKPLPYTLAVTNMILHGIEVPTQIRRDNTLTKPLTSWGKAQRYDVIAANPPFGGTEEDGVENNFPAEFRTRETADLFMALFMRLLKPGGRAGVVLPDGFLFGEGVKTRIKERLLNEFNLHTIVRLPKGVFNPYTGISTNLLFFSKTGPTKDVWFYEHPYPVGYKNYSKTRPMRLEEFDREKEWWGDESDGFTARVESDRAWRMSASEVRARGFNLDAKNPRVVADEDRDPRELLESYNGAVAEAHAVRERLRIALAEAFGYAV
jgi:type I restriction enzyme M protein